MKQCLNARIQGRVQGVGFRYYTEMKAKELGITGWVCNKADSSVEACICGTPEQLKAMQQWLKQGPASADVRQADFSASYLPKNCNDFRIRY